MMNGFERDGEIVAANCISDLLNGWVGGVIQASRDRVYGTAQYYALKMYSEHLGTDRLYIDVTSPDLQPGTPAIDAIATRSADGSKLFIKLSNADATHTIATTIEAAGFPHMANASLSILSSGIAKERNTFEDPVALSPTEIKMQCSRTCTISLLPDSVPILTLDSARI